MRGELHFDAVVIGAGNAGLTAATRLAEGGARVCVLAKGHRLDAPRARDGRRARLRARARGGARARAERARRRAPRPPLRAHGRRERRAGAAVVRRVHRRRSAARLSLRGRPRAQPPAAHRGRRAAPVGARARDDGRGRHAPARAGVHRRDPARCATSTPRCAPPTSRPPGSRRARSRSSSSSIARTPTRSASRGASTTPTSAPRSPRSSRRCLHGDERVGLPAVLGLRDPHGAWADLQRRLGRGVFEIPTLPPSVPGMRAFEALRTALRAAGGRLVLGSEVIGADRDGGRVTAVTRQRRRPRRALPRALVRARHGRLRLGRDRAGLGLGHARDGARPAAARRPRRPASRASWATTSPSSRWRAWGWRSTASLRAEGAENVLVAGASLPGAVPWREGSGEGIALASGHRAAEVALAEGANVGAAA